MDKTTIRAVAIVANILLIVAAAFQTSQRGIGDQAVLVALVFVAPIASLVVLFMGER